MGKSTDNCLEAQMDNLINQASKLVMFTFSSRYKAELVILQLYNKVVLPKIYVEDQN